LGAATTFSRGGGAALWPFFLRTLMSCLPLAGWRSAETAPCGSGTGAPTVVFNISIIAYTW
jgi:hypothetical protein